MTVDLVLMILAVASTGCFAAVVGSFVRNVWRHRGPKGLSVAMNIVGCMAAVLTVVYSIWALALGTSPVIVVGALWVGGVLGDDVFEIVSYYVKASKKLDGKSPRGK